MFIRKRVRDKASGPRVYFTALRSVRTPSGPRQGTVASWSSPADPEHPLYAPSVEAALHIAEAGIPPWASGIERWRELARLHRDHADALVAAGPHKHERPQKYERRCAKADDWAKRIEAKLQADETQIEGLRAVLAEMGNWTWDGQLQADDSTATAPFFRRGGHRPGRDALLGKPIPYQRPC